MSEIPTQDFLFELGCEELPALKLAALARAWQTAFSKQLDEVALGYANITLYYTPRRIAVLVQGLVITQADRTVQRLGPKVKAAYDAQGKPTQAALGFAKSCGVAFEAIKTVETPKGAVLAFDEHLPGRAALDVLPEVITQAAKTVALPKTMRWGDHAYSFLRPVRWLVAMLGDRVIDVSLYGHQAGTLTYGHRVHHPEAIQLNAPSDYIDVLKAAYVLVDPVARKAMIRDHLNQAAKKNDAEVVMDEALLEEVTHLVEWPVVLLGKFDHTHLALPPVVISQVMKVHQKCFPVAKKDGEFLPNFLMVSNIESRDPQRVIAGNERVMRARLADGQFFFEQDQKTKLADRQAALDAVLFQKGLGTLADKSSRMQRLVNYLAAQKQADDQAWVRAAQLAKCDLVTDMVGEFPELQGLMGAAYARLDGEPDAIATAIADHYAPRFAGDALPGTTMGQAVAIADKLDTIAGIFALGQAPTGEKDPFALRRSALGLVRIFVETEWSVDVLALIEHALAAFTDLNTDRLAPEIYDFMLERFKQWCLDQTFTAEAFAAVRAKYPTNILDFYQRLQAVHTFQTHPDASALASANKRVSRLLQKAEITLEIVPSVDPTLLEAAEEKHLFDALTEKQAALAPLVQANAYTDVLSTLAQLRGVIDPFFDHVMVLCEDETLRANRIALLANLRQLFLAVADISLLPGTTQDA